MSVTSSLHTRNLAYSIAFLVGLGPLPGCGDDSTPVPDAGDVNARLDILDPPGDDIGLAYGERVTLRVRYVNEQIEDVAGVPVEFSMIAMGPGEDTAGSTLSSATARTDAQGLAQVDLVAGALDASFRVRVDARDAPTQYFYVTISNNGFARLFITPVHQGWRSAEALSRIEVRLYRASMLACADLDIDAPPESLLPPRSLDGFGGTVSYQNLSAGEPYTVIAWTLAAASSVPLGMGCVDLGAAQLPTSQVYMDLPVRDRDLLLDASPVRAVFDLEPLAPVLDAQGASRPWQILACPAGPGQLLLDCALDALAPDSALDCSVGGTHALVDKVAMLRGPEDASGCRPAMLANMAASLDRELSDAVAAGARFPVGEDLAKLLLARSELLAGFVLESELSMATASATSALHRLTMLRTISSQGEHVLDLGTTSLPVIEQGAVPVTMAGSELTLAEHGFTLRYGLFAAEAFARLGLEPHGLALEHASLGTRLADSVAFGSETGCAALSALACTAVAEPVQCLEAACAQGTSALDSGMTRWWQAFATSGLDLVMAGHAVLHDDDNDLIVDAVGRDDQGQSTGEWSATLRLLDGTAVSVQGASR